MDGKDCTGPGGCAIVDDAGLQGPPQAMFPTERGLRGYGEYAEDGPAAAEKEWRERPDMGPWLKHCWQVHAGPVWMTEPVLKPVAAGGYGVLTCLRMRRR